MENIENKVNGQDRLQDDGSPLTLRCAPDEKRKILQHAKKLGMTFSEFGRTKLLLDEPALDEMNRRIKALEEENRQLRVKLNFFADVPRADPAHIVIETEKDDKETLAEILRADHPNKKLSEAIGQVLYDHYHSSQRYAVMLDQPDMAKARFNALLRLSGMEAKEAEKTAATLPSTIAEIRALDAKDSRTMLETNKVLARVTLWKKQGFVIEQHGQLLIDGGKVLELAKQTA